MGLGTDEAARNQFLSSSLRHLCYSVQEAVLFDSALKTYDLDIVSMIADKQQKVYFVFQTVHTLHLGPTRVLGDYCRIAFKDARRISKLFHLRSASGLETSFEALGECARAFR